MIAAARKHKGRGYDAPFTTTSTPNEQFAFEGADFRIVRRRARHSNRELLDLGKHRLATGQPLNWRAHAYLWARNKRLFKGGVYRDERGKNRLFYQRTYALRWLETTPTAYFGWLGVTAPTDAQREAVESGIASALMSRAKGFCDPDKAAEMLDVTMAERTALRLVTIGAVDCTRDERKVLSMLRKKEADRTRAAAKRAAAGARPRSHSYASVKPWEAFQMSRRTFYRLDEAERAAMLEQAIVDRGTNSSRINTKEVLARDEIVPAEPANVIRLPFRQAAAFRRANSDIRIGSPGWRDRFDAFIGANDDEAGALIAPTPEIAADEEEPVRLDWWNRPDPEFGTGRLTIRSILTGEETTIRLEDGAILSHKPPMEDSYDEGF